MKKLYIEDLLQKTDLLPHQKAGLSYTASGYGSKIPTTKKVFYNNRWHRVYCRIYSNAGTCYIVANKQEIIIN